MRVEVECEISFTIVVHDASDRNFPFTVIWANQNLNPKYLHPCRKKPGSDSRKSRRSILSFASASGNQEIGKISQTYRDTWLISPSSFSWNGTGLTWPVFSEQNNPTSKPSIHQTVYLLNYLSFKQIWFSRVTSRSALIIFVCKPIYVLRLVFFESLKQLISDLCSFWQTEFRFISVL